MFEYKTPPRGEGSAQQTSKETSTNANDNLLKFTLLHRLEAMDDRLQIKQEPDTGHDMVRVYLKRDQCFNKLIKTSL